MIEDDNPASRQEFVAPLKIQVSFRYLPSYDPPNIKISPSLTALAPDAKRLPGDTLVSKRCQNRERFAMLSFDSSICKTYVSSLP